METTAMRSAAASADTGSGPDTPTPPLGLTDPLSLTPAAKASVQILIVDDERTLRESCASMLKHEGYNVRVCSRGEEALETLKRVRFDIVLLDLYMAQVQGMELLRVTLETHPETIVIVMTGHPSVTSNLEALQAGAWDYLPKPFSATHMQILVGRAAHAVMVARETRELQAGNSNEGGTGEKVPLIGVSPSFRRAIDLARRVASTDASVFITGESGVGKEQIAQFIHNHSRRSSRPLVAINCAALPEALLESEMFGHVKGAFTGAVRDKPGLLEMANGGTLFLDELIEMSKPIQAKLLRAIQDGVVRRVGSERTDAVVNVRFIAALGAAARGSILPVARRPDPGAAAARSARRHPPVGHPLFGVLLAAPSGERRTAAQAVRDGGPRAALPAMEGQRAGVAERDRAPGGAAAPGGRRPA